ncbi:hypothetical protein [Bacillus thuringiensis]|uniref:hypothetical protein n=1 Tax=Bacillus thuringiensis TaxID=1428 RepID=UPI000B4233AD|nr:hypothetical protein [Bacillus thuringiensis]ARX66051.1 hypothetical protein BVH75_08335 [Bacillus thuringiensis]MEB9697779.1 hypothetical protein [Bacillus cereus]
MNEINNSNVCILEEAKKQVNILRDKINVKKIQDLVTNFNMQKETGCVSSEEHKFTSLKGAPGIYVFYISFKDEQEFENFKKEWAHFKDNNDKRNNNIPNINKTNMECLKLFDDSKKNKCVMYLGKAEKSIGSRLKQHIIKCTESTYALKLYDFPHLKNYDISYDYYFFNKKLDLDELTIKILLTVFEKKLHNQMKPIIGTRR